VNNNEIKKNEKVKMIFFLHLMTTQHSRKATNKVKEQGKKHIKALKKINRVVGVTQ